MDESDRRGAYESAMRRIDEHVHRNEDGTFYLDLSSALELEIDPVVFADLRRSLEETNKKIISGDIRPSEIN